MMKRSAGIAAVVAVTVGLLFSSVPAQLGFYRWLASRDPKLVGMSPAYNRGVEWGYTFSDLYAQDLSGQSALVTGANAGLGYEISLALARLGALVTMACRNPQKCEEAARRIRSDSRVKGAVVPMIIDTSSLQSVKTFAGRFLEQNETPLDMLYLNAGIVSQQKTGDEVYPLSEDGIELTFATNVVGHHLLYKLLVPAIRKADMARIVLTSSCGSFDSFDYGVATDLDTLNGVKVDFSTAMKIYGQSKLAQILWAKRLARKLGDGSKVYVNAAHPGAVSTEIWDKIPSMPGWMHTVFTSLRSSMWTAEEGALTLLYLGAATDHLKEKNIRGKYFHPQAVQVDPDPKALDEVLQDKVWAFCDELVEAIME